MIHPTAIVSPSARLGRDVRVGAYSIVHDDVDLGDGGVIDSHCEIGYPTPLARGAPLRIGAGAVVRSHSVLYQGSVFGAGLRTGHHAVARENLVVGEGFQLGSFSELQGDCRIGDHCRTHSSVLIGKQTRIGNYVWIYSYSGIANDPHPPSELCLGAVIEDYAVIAVNCVVLAGVRLGAHCLVAAQSCVQRDVPPHMVAAGVPARVRCPTSALRLKDGSRRPAYPWPSHFQRGYPPQVVERWIEEFPAAPQRRAGSARRAEPGPEMPEV